LNNTCDCPFNKQNFFVFVSKSFPREAARAQVKTHYEFKQLRSVREWVMIKRWREAKNNKMAG
jgi:hypothetical protein